MFSNSEKSLTLLLFGSCELLERQTSRRRLCRAGSGVSHCHRMLDCQGMLGAEKRLQSRYHAHRATTHKQTTKSEDRLSLPRDLTRCQNQKNKTKTKSRLIVCGMFPLSLSTVIEATDTSP